MNGKKNRPQLSINPPTDGEALEALPQNGSATSRTTLPPSRSRVIRAVCYYRVSTDKQDEVNQMPELHRECYKRGWKVANEYTDRISGSSTSREKLDIMMDEIRDKRYDALVVQSYDRFGRDEKHLISTLDELSDLGIHFVSVQEQLDTSSDVGRLAFVFLAGIAKFMRTQIGKKTRAALQRKKAEGMKLGRPTIPDDVRSRVYALADQGVSIRNIAKQIQWVRASGEYGPRKVKNISKSVVFKLLKERPLNVYQNVASVIDGDSVA